MTAHLVPAPTGGARRKRERAKTLATCPKVPWHDGANATLAVTVPVGHLHPEESSSRQLSVSEQFVGYLAILVMPSPEGRPGMSSNDADVHQGPLIHVDDPADPQLGLYRDLNDPAARGGMETAHSIFVVEGKLTVERLLTSAYRIRSLLVDDHQVTASSDLVTATRARGVPVYVGSRAAVAETVGFNLHRGVVAVAERPSPLKPERVLADAVQIARAAGSFPLVAILEGLNDYENIGALFRNAAAFGVTGVLLDPSSADPLYRRSIRVSVGYVLHMSFARLTPWPAGLQQARDAGFLIAAMTPRTASAADVPTLGLAALKDRMSGRDRPQGLALLLGAEGPGLTQEAIAASDVVVSIPMAGGVDSLNVATAAAVAFHAALGT